MGPTQFIVMINGRVRSYSKSTGLPDGQLNADTDTFWVSAMTPVAGAITSNFTSDPHIRYDRLSDKWYAVMIDVPNVGAAQNRIMVAVSDTGTITSSTVWHFFSFQSPVGEFADYPTLGIDANALYIGTNDFTLGGVFVNTDAYVVRKSSLTDNGFAGPIVVTPFTGVIDPGGSGPFTPQGVDNPTPGATTGYFAGVDANAFGQIDILPVTNPGGTPTLGTMQPVAVPQTQYPINVPYAGNGGKPPLDALEDRLFAAQIRDGHLWTAHNVGVVSDGTSPSSQGSVTRTASRWYDITLGSPSTLNKSGTIFDASATNPRSYWIPSVAVNGQGTMAIGGTTAGAAARPDAWFSSLQPGDSAVATPTLYTSTASDYAPPYVRWGDYSLTSVDPTDDQTMWTIQEYVASNSTWGTKIAKLLAPAPAAPTSASPASAVTGSASAHVTLTAPVGAGWFDPGAGFPNRFAVSDSCGAPISNLTLTDARTTTFDLDLHAVGEASCSFTVTNPDGQSATGTGLFATTSAPTPTATTPQPVPATTTTTPATAATTPTTTTPVSPALPAAVRCVVPTLKGMRLTAARRALSKAHCRPGKVSRVRRAAVRHQRVVSSSPGAGRRLAAGSRVNLVVRR